MGLLSNKLRSCQDNGIIYWCQGCKSTHMIRYGEGSGPRWSWNGNVDKPTFGPSVLVTGGHYVVGHDGGDCWCTYNAAHPDKPAPFTCERCHTFINDGMVQFLGDCTHALAGQTLPLPDLPDYMLHPTGE